MGARGADASAGGSGCGPLLARDFFYSPSAGEIPLQRRTLRSLYPIPPFFAATLVCFLKVYCLRYSLGNLVSLITTFNSLHLLKPVGSRGRRFGGRIGLWAAVGSGFLLFPPAGEIPLQRRTLRSLYPIPPSSAATLAGLI